MLPKTCFICNETSVNYQNDLTQVKSQHSGYPFLIFMRKFLRKSILSRNISNANNCVCERCIIRVNEYDDLCVKAKRIEDDLHELLIKSDKASKTTNEEVQIDCQSHQTPSKSDDDRNEEEDNQYYCTMDAENFEDAESVDNQESELEDQLKPLPYTNTIHYIFIFFFFKTLH